MKKFWAILRHEYTRHVLRKRFILVLLSVPAYLLFMFALATLSVWITLDFRPVGFVDQAGLISDPTLPEALSLGPLGVKFVPFADEQAGRAALDAKQIQSLFLLPENFRAAREARLVSPGAVDSRVESQFYILLRYNLLHGEDASLRRAVLEPPTIEVHAVGVSSGMAGANLLRVAVPLGAGFLLLAAILSTSGYLVQAVVEEKENRTMEILATSAPAGAIINAKLTAYILIGLTQLSAWLAPPLALLALALAYAPIPIPPFNLGLTLLAMVTILPTFMMIAAGMAAVAVTLTEVREGQQVMSVFSMAAMFPFLAMMVVMASPNGTLAVVLSFLPPTAALTLIMRAAFDSVPPWQIGLSGLIITMSAAGSMWMLGRIFREAMLVTGSRMANFRILIALLPGSLARPVERFASRFDAFRTRLGTRLSPAWRKFAGRAAAQHDTAAQALPAASPGPAGVTAEERRGDEE